MPPARTGSQLPSGGESGAIIAPAPLEARLERVLQALRATATDEGFVSVAHRSLAASLGLSTVTARALVGRLVAGGQLVPVGWEVHALADTSGVRYATEAEPAGARTEPHDAVHQGTGSAILW